MNFIDQFKRRQAFRLIRAVLWGILILSNSAALAGEWKKLDARTISFEGTIEEGDFEKFNKLLDKKTTRMIVWSPGGFGPEAAKIGLAMMKHGIDIYVNGTCASACANALFAAGRNKYLSGSLKIGGEEKRFDGKVCFHGGTGITGVNRQNMNMLVELDSYGPNTNIYDFYARDPNHQRQYLKKVLLNDAKLGRPETSLGVEIRSDQDFDLYDRRLREAEKKELEILNRAGLTERVLNLNFEVNSPWVCPTAKGFSRLGLKNVVGRSSELEQLRSAPRREWANYVFDGIYPEEESACAQDLANLKQQGRCSSVNDISCLRNSLEFLTVGCQQVMGFFGSRERYLPLAPLSGDMGKFIK